MSSSPVIFVADGNIYLTLHAMVYMTKINIQKGPCHTQIVVIIAKTILIVILNQKITEMCNYEAQTL